MDICTVREEASGWRTFFQPDTSHMKFLMRLNLRDSKGCRVFLDVPPKKAQVNSRDNPLNRVHPFNETIATIAGIHLLFHTNCVKISLAMHTLEGVFIFFGDDPFIRA